VVALLDGELHGYALVRRVEELSDGAVRMGPGSLYGSINRLVEQGLLIETTGRVGRAENGRRRFFALSPAGRAVALDELGRLPLLVHRVTRHLPGPASA
jgi:DNA-binding PadR family transcriptional regulator